jgi:hypothetical protein
MLRHSQKLWTTINWWERIHAYTTRVKYIRRIWIYIYIHNYICTSIQSIFTPNNPPSNVAPVSRTTIPGWNVSPPPSPSHWIPLWGLTPWSTACRGWAHGASDSNEGRDANGTNGSGEAVAKGAAVRKRENATGCEVGNGQPNGYRIEWGVYTYYILTILYIHFYIYIIIYIS